MAAVRPAAVTPQPADRSHERRGQALAHGSAQPDKAVAQAERQIEAVENRQGNLGCLPPAHLQRVEPVAERCLARQSALASPAGCGRYE